MNLFATNIRGRLMALAIVLLLVPVSGSWAAIDGIAGTTFNLTARTGHISTPDGGSFMIWGYANADAVIDQVQYPGPTLIVNQNDVVTVNLTNTLPEPVSILFPGQQVVATGGLSGPITQEVPADNGITTVSYTFTASQPGTYTYYSGSHMDLQVEMGLVGVIIVRPAAQTLAACSQYTTSAYGDCRSAYDYEFLFLLTEMDPNIHRQVEMSMLGGETPAVDTTTFWPTVWFINGRAAPDTMAMAGATWLPTQPYNCMPRLNPGGRLLLRMIGGGRDSHPFHTHGNNFDLIAQDGRLLESAAGATIAGEVGVLPDLKISNFTQTVAPGSTYDAIFTWTGKDLGFDIYGHQQDLDNPPTGNFPGPEDVDHNGNGVLDNVAASPTEYLADHGKPFPVIFPDKKDLTFGMSWSGSPFLGSAGPLPPGEGGFNVNNGLFFMWHSHNEKEMTNNDIFPGGMMTMFIVEPPGIVIQ